MNYKTIDIHQAGWLLIVAYCSRTAGVADESKKPGIKNKKQKLLTFIFIRHLQSQA